MMEVTQVKRTDEKTTVLWTVPNGRHTAKGSLEGCTDVPEQDFLDQMATVEADLGARTKFGKAFERGLTLTGISMTRNHGGRRQYTPSVLIDFGWGPNGHSMPFLLEPDSEQGAGSEKVLTPAEHKNIETLFELAARYTEPANRHQSKLELEDEEGVAA